MESINQQLKIRTPKNPLMPSRYARGLNTYMPQLGSEDWSLDFYNDTAAMENYSNFGVAGLNLGYPTCFTTKCRYCKNECQGKGLKWLQGGKACHTSCVASYIEGKGKAPSSSTPVPTNIPVPTDVAPVQSEPQKSGMSGGAVAGIVIGGVVVLGLAAFLLMRKK